MDHCLFEDLPPKRLTLLDEAAPRSMGRNELKAVGQAHECALAWTDELKYVLNVATEVTLKLVLPIFNKFPAEKRQEDD